MRRSSLTLVGAGIAITIAAVALLAPLVAPYDAHDLVGGSLEPPSTRHLLGTDDVGHDVVSQLIWGTRASAAVAGAGAALAMALAVVVGVSAGLLGGAVDRATLLVLDAGMGIPMLPLLVLVTSLAGPSRLMVILVIGFVLWPFQARVLRAQTRTIRQRGYVAAAHGLGGGLIHAMRRHVVPAVAPLVVAGLVRTASIAVVLEAGLAFLGLSDPLAVSWGMMLNRALTGPAAYAEVWTWWVPPTVAITFTIVGLTFLAVALEPVTNRRLGRVGTPA